jgi:hypothetical protein
MWASVPDSYQARNTNTNNTTAKEAIASSANC